MQYTHATYFINKLTAYFAEEPQMAFHCPIKFNYFFLLVIIKNQTNKQTFKRLR
jgi:hypothetical protein